MADYPNTVVHVDTPRPGPKRRINIRLHPESRNRRWGPRVQKLSTVPPPLVDWSSDDQTDGLCKGANVKKENATSFSDIFGALQDESLKDETSTDGRVELNRDALRSRDDEGDGERASESDEDSSSSKRSREEMEDGLEEDTANQLKRTRTEGEDGDLNMQDSIERNEKSTNSGSSDRKERTPSKKAVICSTNQDPSKGGESTGRENTTVGCQEKASEVENDCEQGKLNPRAQEIRIHMALKKQVADKMQIPRPLDGVGKIQEGDTDSTEESEEEKENWKKVVESLTTNVGELEPVQSLSNQLKQSICSPPTASLQDQPVFMHPWGLFPFRPIGPYSPCPPCWIQPPVFYPYAQPVPVPVAVPVPPGMQLPPSCSASPGELSNAQAPRTDNSECKTIATTPGYCHSNSSKVLNFSTSERSPIDVTARQHQSLSDAEGVEEVTGERRQNNTTLPETPSQPPSRRKVYVPGKITQMKDRKCDFSRSLKEEDVTGKKGESNSYISLMNQESSVSLYSPTTEKCPKSSLNDDRGSPRNSKDQVIDEKDSLPWQRSWRGGPAMLRAVQSSAPPAISTAKRSDPASFSDSLRGSTQWETSRNNAVTPGSSWANTPRAQLVARIQPRRRLTLQEEVMMTSTPKSFHQQFGVPASSSETLEADVVYPWSNVEYVDTHCHIDFLYQRLGCNGTFEKFGRMRGFPDNYGGCVAIFCTPESFHPTNELWQNLLKEDKIWAAFGCHPHHVKVTIRSKNSEFGQHVIIIPITCYLSNYSMESLGSM